MDTDTYPIDKDSKPPERGYPPDKMGRPRLLPDLNKVRELAARGCTMSQIAAHLRISEATLYKRKRDWLEFAQVIKEARGDEAVFITGAIHKLIEEGDTAATIFAAKTRLGWKESQDININGSMEIDSPQSQDTANYKRLIEVATPEERDALAMLLAKLQRRLKDGAEAKPAIETSSTASEPDIRMPAITYDDDEDED